MSERARVWVAGVCVHILFDLRSRDSPSAAERQSSVCVPRLSMEHLRDEIIAVSSASLPA